MARNFSSARFGGGSSRSGSSSFGGGRHSSFGGGSSHSSIGPLRPRRPIRINFFGSRVVVSTGKQSLLMVLFVFLLFSIFGCFVANINQQEHKQSVENGTKFIQKIESDSQWFLQAKAKADQTGLVTDLSTIEEDDCYIAYATYSAEYKYSFQNKYSTGYAFDRASEVIVDGVTYYYLCFTFEVPKFSNGQYVGTETYQKFTYSTFNDDQAQQWNRKIVVGKNSLGVWDALNYNYSLENNVEYNYSLEILDDCKNDLKSATTAKVITIILIVVFVIILIIAIVFTIKKGKEEYKKQQALKDEEIAQAQAKTLEADRRARQVGRHCAYCGGAVPDGEDTCESCGAKVFK